MRLLLTAIGGLVLLGAASGRAAPLTLDVPGLANGAMLPTRYAFCAEGADHHQTPAPDLSPPLAWAGAPAATRSFAITMIDPDVPSRVTRPELKSGIPANAPRESFTHWLLADIPARLHGLPAGADSAGPMAHGKPAIHTKYGVRGANDFTIALIEDARHNGVHAGYDGPCPPSIDLLAHRYQIHLYALDTPSLGLDPGFQLDDLTAAMRGHILADTVRVVPYSTHPGLAPRPPL